MDLFQGQPGLQSESQDSQDCFTEKPCLEKTMQEQSTLMYVCGHTLVRERHEDHEFKQGSGCRDGSAIKTVYCSS